MNYFNGIESQMLIDLNAAIGSPLLSFLAGVISFFGNTGIGFIVLGLVLLVPRKTRQAGGCVLLSIVFSALLVNVCLKPMVARIRPYDFTSMIPYPVHPMGDLSFPSGHTSVAFSSAFALRTHASKKWFIFTLVFAALMGFSRMVLMVHYPTDVLGGVIAGTVCGLLATFVWKKAADYVILKSGK